MSIDLNIPGDRVGLSGLAEWLAPIVSEPLINADLDLAYASNDSQTYWIGQAGDAFRETTMKLRNGSSMLPAFLQDIAEVLRAYSNRLGRGQEQFDDLAAYASQSGLSVYSKRVMRPTTKLRSCPTDGAPTSEQKEYDRYLQTVEAYDKVAVAYENWWGDTYEWVETHFAPLIARIEDLRPISAVDALVKAMKIGPADIAGAGIAYVGERVVRKTAADRARYNARQGELDRLRNQRRSGNPALRAEAGRTNFKGMSRGLADLNTQIVNGVKLAKVIPVGGTVVTVAAAGYELAHGGSASSIGMGLAGGTAAGAGALAIFAPMIPTPAIVVGIAGTAAVLAGGAATWLWEASMPLDAREAIDAGLVGPPPILAIGSPTNAAGVAG